MKIWWIPSLKFVWLKNRKLKIHGFIFCNSTIQYSCHMHIKYQGWYFFHSHNLQCICKEIICVLSAQANQKGQIAATAHKTTARVTIATSATALSPTARDQCLPEVREASPIRTHVNPAIEDSAGPVPGQSYSGILTFPALCLSRFSETVSRYVKQ